MSIKVLIADDHALVRAGFRALITAEPDLVVVGEASTGLDAVEQAELTQPDIVLMDIRMPQLDGIEATRRIIGSSKTAGSRVIILTTFDLDEYVYASLRAGASGFLLKDTPPAELLHAIHVVAGGDALIAPAITKRLIAEFANRPHDQHTTRSSDVVGRGDAITGRITDREREVLALVTEGLSNEEIATRLHISPHTAKTHVSRLLTKLDARDRVQLVILGYRIAEANSRATT